MIALERTFSRIDHDHGVAVRQDGVTALAAPWISQARTADRRRAISPVLRRIAPISAATIASDFESGAR